MRRTMLLAAALVLLAAVPAAAADFADLGTDDQQARGKELYDKYCSQCHGVNGDAEAYATLRVNPRPRDFTPGKYKFRTTPSGMLPTDDDIARVIKVGLPSTSMPGWPMFSDTDIQNIVYYLKTFAEAFQDPSKAMPPIEIPSPPPMTEESIANGEELYTAQGCNACHGNLGRGDGLSAKTLRDDWGTLIRPVDMTKRWTFRGGPSRQDIYTRFSTGVNGTPMPSYGETLAVEDRWDLTNYIYSLADSDTPDYADLVRAEFVEDEIDLDNAEELFAEAQPARFPVIGQIVQPGRNFYPLTSDVVVRVVYNRKDIAVMLQWHDLSADTTGSNAPDIPVPVWDEDNPADAGGGGDEEDDLWGDEDDLWSGDDDEWEDDFWDDEATADAGDEGEAFSDAVAIQWPSQLPTGNRKPYFLFGDAGNSVDLWFADLAKGLPQQFVGRGADSIESSDADVFEMTQNYDTGRWTVIFKRPRRSSTNVSFDEDTFVPVAFSIWDGFNRERGNKRALSRWLYVHMTPSEEVSPVGPMVRVALIVLLVELVAIFWIRHRAKAKAAEAAGEMIPQGG